MIIYMMMAMIVTCATAANFKAVQYIVTDLPEIWLSPAYGAVFQVFEMNPYLWVGLPGLATDIQTVKRQ